jgi:hypothetical protein
VTFWSVLNLIFWRSNGHFYLIPVWFFVALELEDFIILKDFSDTNALNREDIEMLVKCFIGEDRQLSDDDMELLLNKVGISSIPFMSRLVFFQFSIN